MLSLNQLNSVKLSLNAIPSEWNGKRYVSFTHLADSYLAATPISHSGLSNLAADDHPQYHNDVRGDTRYYTKANVDTLLTDSNNLAIAYAIALG